MTPLASGVKHYPATPCFFLSPTGRYRVSLRRYVRGGSDRCGGPIGVHEASVEIATEEHVARPMSGETGLIPDDDPRWPNACAHCGHAFAKDDPRQVNFDELHARSDGGAETTLRDAPPGAMWDAVWMPDACKVDGRYLIVRLPNGRDWCIDDEASNCTRKGDAAHKCWVRHGDPPNLTVDKNGNTCSAGAGSILAGDYHGFLRNGVLTEC